jgi:malate dehydrogenase (oxaloacetate-decarboxylating)(NADP+)
VSLGLPRANITVGDIKGVVYKGRTEEMDPEKARYAQSTPARTLAEILPGADIFLGLSAGGVLKPEMIMGMAEKPLILALANPEPEIRPEIATQARPDAILCTGRSDYPNQVNNVLCFPFIFRGALDVGATQINEAMKLAAVHAIAELARAEASDVVASAYGGEAPRFGSTYLIPKPFDPRLICRIAPAVAKAAIDSGVATRPLDDLDAYGQRLERFVYHSGTSMQPVFQAAKAAPKRVIYAEGEEERVLRAVQVVVDEGLAFPVLLGRADVIARRIETLGLRLKVGATCEVVNILSDPRYPSVVAEYYELGRRRGVTEAIAKEAMRSRASLIAAMLLRRGDVDAMLCGTVGTFGEHLHYVREVVGRRPGVLTLAAMNMLMLPDRQLFICDTYVNRHPTAVEVAEMTLLAAEEVRRFGVTPVAALLSHSSFGSSDAPEAQVMREARAILLEHDPGLVVEGEMQGDAALSKPVLDGLFPGSRLSTEANLLIMPSVDAANIAYNLLKVTAGHGITIGPILLGAAKPVHILEPGVTVRRIVNMTALATVDASVQR